MDLKNCKRQDLKTNYWDHRTKRYGHTGWSNQATYSFDQFVRINSVQFVLEKLTNKSLALDFGCGSGEFTNILSQKFEKAIGFDISELVLKIAKDKFDNPRVKFTSNYEEIKEAKLDLILVITVLQHIVEEHELIEVLRQFCKQLAPNGSIIILESFSDTETKNEYLNLRKFSDFNNLLNKNGLEIVEIKNFYHPKYYPLANYIKFKSNYCTLILNKLAYFDFPYSRKLLKAIAKKYTVGINGFITKTSPTKLLIIKHKP
jgi:ubiquinone/menaquinone biosynthesis C-methylase UbiE